jgi:hypothetical protein
MSISILLVVLSISILLVVLSISILLVVLSILDTSLPLIELTSILVALFYKRPQLTYTISINALYSLKPSNRVYFPY